MEPGEERSGPATAQELWLGLAAEMRAARERSGLTIENWLKARDLTYSVSHISNVEHGRSRPRRELAAAYDDRAAGETVLLHLWDEAHAAQEAEERAKDASNARRRGLPPAPAAEDAVPKRGSARRRSGKDSEPSPRDRRGRGFAAVACVVLAAVAAPVVVVLTEPSSKEFADQADAICVGAKRPLRAVQAGLAQVGALLAAKDPAARPELDRQIAAVQALIGGPVKQLKDLDRPWGTSGERAEEFVNGTSDAAFGGQAILKRMAEMIRDGELDEALQQLKVRNDFDRDALRRDTLAKDLGAAECARVKLGRAWGRSSAPDD